MYGQHYFLVVKHGHSVPMWIYEEVLTSKIWYNDVECNNCKEADEIVWISHKNRRTIGFNYEMNKEKLTWSRNIKQSTPVELIRLIWHLIMIMRYYKYYCYILVLFYSPSWYSFFITIFSFFFKALLCWPAKMVLLWECIGIYSICKFL